MRGMLGLSMTPMASAVRLSGASNSITEVRSVIEFNGTQWGVFSDRIVLDDGFELEVTVSGIPEGTSSVAKVMFSILQANSSGKNIHIGRRNGDILTFAFYSSDINVDLAGLIDWNKVNTFNCKYDHSTGEKVIFLNGSEVAREVQPKLNIDWNLPVSTYFMKRLNDNNGITQGTLFSTKVWTNGDSNTGDLILDVPFDESGSDYQRNRAEDFTDCIYCSKKDGALAVQTSSLPRAETIEYPDGSWRFQRIEGGESGVAQVRVEYGDAPVGSYKLTFNGSTSGSVAIMIRRKSDNSNLDFFAGGSIDRERTFYNDDSSGFYIQIEIYSENAEAHCQVDNFVVEGWSGVILQNALPEHWLQIERKRYWDYWLDSGVVGFAGFNSIDWSINPDGTASVTTTKQISGPSTVYSLEYSLTIGDVYEVSFESVDWVGDGRVGFSFETFGRPGGAPINDRSVAGNAKFTKELVATGTALSLFRYVGSGVGSGRIKNLVVRRKLEIAQ